MKNLILSTAAAALLSTSALATNISTDFFKANGYTKPSQSIVDIQTKIDNGTYTQYPFVSGISNTGLFDKKLKPGMALPQIKNVTNLLKALDKKQEVKVASNGGEFVVCLPVFAEIAKQNGATCTDLMNHLVSGQADGEDFFSNIDEVMDKIQSKVDEIVSELGDDISNEVANEIADDIRDDITDDITEEIEDDLNQYDLNEELLNAIDESVDSRVREAVESFGSFITPAIENQIANSHAISELTQIANGQITDVTQGLESLGFDHSEFAPEAQKELDARGRQQ